MELDNIIIVHWLLLIDTNCATFIFSPSLALEKHYHNLEQKASQWTPNSFMSKKPVNSIENLQAKGHVLLLCFLVDFGLISLVNKLF